MATKKMHLIEKELADALKLKRGAKESDKAWAAKLHEKGMEKSEEDEEFWEGLEEETQGWLNAYTSAKDAEKDLPDFDHAEAKDEPAEEPEEQELSDEEKPAKKASAKSKPDKAPAKAKESAAKGDKPAKGKKEAPPAKSKPKAAEKAEKAPAKPAKKASSGQRGGKLQALMQVILDHADGDTDAVKAAARKKGIEVSDSTISTVRSDFIRAARFLHEQGLMKRNPFPK